MTKELVVRLRDDLAGILGADVVTREFAWEGTRFEIELSDAHYAEMCQVMWRYLDVARSVRISPVFGLSQQAPTVQRLARRPDSGRRAGSASQR
jgi:hypothetical protein